MPVSSAAGRRVSVSVTVDLSFGARGRDGSHNVAGRPPTGRHRARGRCGGQGPKVTQDRDTGKEWFAWHQATPGAWSKKRPHGTGRSTR